MVETQVMGAFLNARGRRGPPVKSRPPRLCASFRSWDRSPPWFPRRNLQRKRQLSQETDLFLCDHALGGPVSVKDPELRDGCLPLTMSMELLAEAGGRLDAGTCSGWNARDSARHLDSA